MGEGKVRNVLPEKLNGFYIAPNQKEKGRGMKNHNPCFRIFLWKRLVPLLFFPFIILLAGCRAEMWIDRTGAGHGVFYIPSYLMDKNSLESEIRKSRVTVISVEENNGYVIARIKWNTPEQGGINRHLNSDGTITLDLGSPAGFESFIVHVDGKVLETVGKKIDDNTVDFGNLWSTRATLTYKPKFNFTILLGIVLGAFVIFVGIWIALVMKKKPSQKTNFCIQCGKQNERNAKFCIYCGKPLNKGQ